MLGYLLDTDICIYSVKARNPQLAARFAANDGRMAISDVTLFELLYGAERYAEPAARIQIIQAFTARLEILPFDSRAAQHAAQIRASLERKGEGIGAYDLMIAGCARSQGLVIVTNNVKEFERVEGLRIERWI